MDCPGLGISITHGSGDVPRQVTLIEINVKALLFDLYEKYVGRIMVHRGLGLKTGAGDVGGADSVEAPR